MEHVLPWLDNVVVELIPPGQSGQSGAWDVRQWVKVQPTYRSCCRQQERYERGGLDDLEDSDSHLNNFFNSEKVRLCVSAVFLGTFVSGRS